MSCKLLFLYKVSIFVQYAMPYVALLSVDGTYWRLKWNNDRESV